MPVAPQPDPPALVANGSAPGSLVAVTTGAPCTFIVNGAARGSGTQVRIQLKPGTYSVSCKPTTGVTKSRSVTIASGESRLVSFKL
jgi:serine/threonine-protein kinase